MLKCLLPVLVSPKSENKADTGLPNCCVRYFWTSGLSKSGLPSSIAFKKLRLVKQVVFKNCSYCPKTTLVPLMYPAWRKKVYVKCHLI